LTIGHETSVIATIAAGLGLAFVFGLIASRLKLPLIIGYIVAGLLIGPATPGFVADPSVAHQLSEIGVSLLMFGVGLHFSLDDLWAVRKVAIPGALIRVVVASILGAAIMRLLDVSWGAGLVFGLALTVSSTVVLLRALAERGEIESANGRIAVGWLIVEDVVTVIALVLLPALAGALGGRAPADNVSVPIELLITLGKITLFAAAMLLVGKRVIPRVLGRVARTGSRELFTVGVLGIALGVAFGAQWLFGVSPALGAFLAGVVIAESDLSYQAGAETLPLQEAFTVLFFVAVGMLFDPAVIVQHPLAVLMALFVVLVGKSLLTAGIILFFRYPVSNALAVSASLAQIGEFSFILVGLAVGLEILSETARNIVVAVAIISIGVNSLILQTVAPIDRWLKRRPKLLYILERPHKGRDLDIAPPAPDLKDHVVMIGYGRVGRIIGEALTANRVKYSVVEIDRYAVDELRAKDIHTVFGDAARPGILARAHIRLARLLVVATPDSSQAQEIIRYARKVNPQIDVCVRTHSFEDEALYASLGVGGVVMGEKELGLELAHYALVASGRTERDADRTVARLRGEPSESWMV
jgi:CPA2 family monovalent cation:H+ antiporter-2